MLREAERERRLIKDEIIELEHEAAAKRGEIRSLLLALLARAGRAGSGRRTQPRRGHLRARDVAQARAFRPDPSNRSTRASTATKRWTSSLERSGDEAHVRNRLGGPIPPARAGPRSACATPSRRCFGRSCQEVCGIPPSPAAARFQEPSRVALIRVAVRQAKPRQRVSERRQVEPGDLSACSTTRLPSLRRKVAVDHLTAPPARRGRRGAWHLLGARRRTRPGRSRRSARRARRTGQRLEHDRPRPGARLVDSAGAGAAQHHDPPIASCRRTFLAPLAREEVDAVDEPHPVAARAHDERVRARRVGEEADAAQQVAVRDARRGDDHLLRREVVDREDAVEVVDAVRARLLDLGAPRRPELRLQLAAEAAERGRREHRLPRAADPDREVVVRSAHGGADRRGHVAVLDQLDARAGGADLLDQVVVARPVEDDRRDVVDHAAERVGDRADVVADRARRARSRPRARGPTAILRMYMSGSDGIEPRGAAAIIEIAFVAAARDDRATLERVEREVELLAARADRPCRPRAARRPRARRSRSGR